MARSESAAAELREQLAAQASQHEEVAADLQRGRDAVLARVSELEEQLSAQGASDAGVAAQLQVIIALHIQTCGQAPVNQQR